MGGGWYVGGVWVVCGVWFVVGGGWVGGWWCTMGKGDDSVQHADAQRVGG